MSQWYFDIIMIFRDYQKPLDILMFRCPNDIYILLWYFQILTGEVKGQQTMCVSLVLLSTEMRHRAISTQLISPSFHILNHSLPTDCFFAKVLVTITIVSYGLWKTRSVRKNWPLLEMLATFKRLLACSCSQNFHSCSHARILVKLFILRSARCFQDKLDHCSCSQKIMHRSHARKDHWIPLIECLLAGDEKGKQTI